MRLFTTNGRWHHWRKDCYHLQGKPVHEVVREDYAPFSLCGDCFTGKLTAVKYRCRKCRQTKAAHPCVHNGGVLVETDRGVAWVWPESVYGRTLVNPAQVR